MPGMCAPHDVHMTVCFNKEAARFYRATEDNFVEVHERLKRGDILGVTGNASESHDWVMM